MPIKYVNWITREMVRADREAVFIFGDNVKRQGYGGQAKAMRGEPNAIGIVTKRAPDMSEGSFFTDTSPEDRAAFEADLRLLTTVLSMNKTVYVPTDGLGTGLSQLPQRAPVLYRELVEFFERHSPDGCPWPR
jgi:hypothetical protein